MKWENLCQWKGAEGLGFRYLRQFNIALLTKQGWRMLIEQDCLMVRVMRAKYFPNGNFLNSQLGGSRSTIWRSIWESRDFLLRGCRVRVGNGVDINV